METEQAAAQRLWQDKIVRKDWDDNATVRDRAEARESPEEELPGLAWSRAAPRSMNLARCRRLRR